jgi:hypothetical protein
MAFASKQTRGRIEPDPTGARQIDLGPGMQVGKILRRARRPLEGPLISRQLDEIARNKPGRQAQMA